MNENSKPVRFREIDRGTLIDVYPAHVRAVRQTEHGVEIVFTEQHSIMVKGTRPGAVRALAGETPIKAPVASTGHEHG